MFIQKKSFLCILNIFWITIIQIYEKPCISFLNFCDKFFIDYYMKKIENVYE